ncbi:MAG: 3-hydroxyacyl-CoA dehydrogenase family protein [Candidatus Lambdaproteobacteria bacterium]|nr:3-hydroxyacyl-CoA dehydrogenase family protein [Candidatus Lambdaproteobacteria bacterium]
MKLGLLGSGLMSRQIAVLFAEFGCEIVVWNRVLRPGAPAAMRAEAEQWRKDPALLLPRIAYSDALADLAGCELIVESIVEDPAVKKTVLGELSRVVPGAIIACNTSSLNIEDLSTAVQGAERFLGLHFLSPLQRVRFLEICPCSRTSPQTLATLRALLQRYGFPFREVPDVPGYLVNHLLMAMLSAAMHLVQDRGVSPQLIDDALKLAKVTVSGPLQVADYLGLDTCLRVMESIQRQTGDARFAPTDMLRRMVAEGRLGVSSGQGFYNHAVPDAKAARPGNKPADGT